MLKLFKRILQFKNKFIIIITWEFHQYFLKSKIISLAICAFVSLNDSKTRSTKSDLLKNLLDFISRNVNTIGVPDSRRFSQRILAGLGT